MIRVENLTKSYGGFTAVDDVSFTAEAGRVTGFLGPNGAGKTTTMRVMTGLTPPTRGSVTIGGHRYADLPNPGRMVGVMLDASAQHPGRTGLETLKLSAMLQDVPSKRVHETLELVESCLRAHACCEQHDEQGQTEEKQSAADAVQNGEFACQWQAIA